MYIKRPSAYLKMRVMAAIEYAVGCTIRERIKNVSLANFIDEWGEKRQFT